LRQVVARPVMDMGLFFQVLVILELIAFGLFILVVLCDQISIILNRMTVLDRVLLHEDKLRRYKKRGCKNFKIAFGGDFGLHWFLPT
jgi:hypothetical protein